nr:MAG TPA: hypothetical protein [Herelleviridae sp.]
MEAATEAAGVYGTVRGRSAVRRGCGRRKERRAGDRGAAAGGRAELSGTDPAQDLSAAAGADRQDDAVLQARLPQGKVQLLGALLDVPQRGEDLFRIHVPRAG